jgi:hypothetical protein
MTHSKVDSVPHPRSRRSRSWRHSQRQRVTLQRPLNSLLLGMADGGSTPLHVFFFDDILDPLCPFQVNEYLDPQHPGQHIWQ